MLLAVDQQRSGLVAAVVPVRQVRPEPLQPVAMEGLDRQAQSAAPVLRTRAAVVAVQTLVRREVAGLVAAGPLEQPVAIIQVQRVRQTLVVAAVVRQRPHQSVQQAGREVQVS